MRFSPITDRCRLLEQTYERIMFEWLPHSGYKVAGPDFERYSADFDVRKGTGTVEMSLPIGSGADTGARCHVNRHTL